VAVIRVAADRLDYLLLADCFLVLGQASGEPLVITDEREQSARRICSAPLADLDCGTAEYKRVRDSCIEQLQARRNQPGGYWIAKDDPARSRTGTHRKPAAPGSAHCRAAEQWRKPDRQPVCPDKLVRTAGRACRWRTSRDHPPRSPCRI
jgi:hypothetical protein